MSKVYATSDWHFGHRNILKYRPQFSSIEEHDNTIIQNYLDVVTKRDVVYFSGDVAFSEEGLARIAELPGDKRLILGNHDTEFLHIDRFSSVFTKVHGMFKKYGVWFTHAPIHPSELRGKFNIHGHTHGINVNDPRYYNVSLENTDYRPVDIKTIIHHLEAINNYPDWVENIPSLKDTCNGTDTNQQNTYTRRYGIRVKT